MKVLSSFLAVLMLVASVSAFANNKDVAPGENECSPEIDSKTYLSTDFSLVYPRKARFECKYKCRSKGKIEVIAAVSEMTVSSMDDDAKSVVCQGVEVKKVTWGYDFDKIVPFYAFSTNMKEIKRWAFQNINQNPKNNSRERELLAKLKIDINQIAGSFIMAGINGGVAAAPFKEAGEKLSRIADKLPLDTTELDQVIAEIIVNRGQTSGYGADSLVHKMISSSAAWKIPTHQF